MAIAWIGTKRFTIRKVSVHPWYSVGACLAFWLGCALAILLTSLMASKLSFNNPLIYAVLCIVGALFVMPSLMIFFRALVTVIMKFRHRKVFFWAVMDERGNVVDLIPIYKIYNTDPSATLNSYLKRYNLKELEERQIKNEERYRSMIIKFM